MQPQLPDREPARHLPLPLCARHRDGADLRGVLHRRPTASGAGSVFTAPLDAAGEDLSAAGQGRVDVSVQGLGILLTNIMGLGDVSQSACVTTIDDETSDFHFTVFVPRRIPAEQAAGLLPAAVQAGGGGLPRSGSTSCYQERPALRAGRGIGVPGRPRWGAAVPPPRTEEALRRVCGIRPSPRTRRAHLGGPPGGPAKLAPGYVERDRAGAFPWETLKLLADSGLLGVHVPAEAGGQGAGELAAGLVCEELGRADYATALMIIQAGTAGKLLWRLGSERVKEQWLPPGDDR